MTSRAEQIAAKIHDDVATNLPALVHRDRELLAGVCRELGLAVDPIQMGQVATLMKLRNLTTHDEFPKWVYPNGPEQPGVLVANATAERAAMTPKISVVK